MACVGTYSPEFTDLIVSTGDATHIVTGFAEGTFITIEPFASRFEPYYGAKGDASRAHNPVKAFNMTVTLAQTSHSNDVFSQILKNDRETLNGTFELTFKDSSGTTILTEECSYITEEPSQAFSGGGTIESREWSITLPGPTDYTIGGNGTFDSATQSDYEGFGGEVDPQWQASQ